MNWVGYLLLRRGQLDDAERYLREALAGRRRVLGREHSLTIQTADYLANIVGTQVREARQQHAIGDDEAAEALARHWLAMARDTLGDEHAQTAAALALLGEIFLSRKAHEDAEVILRECLEIRRRALPEGDWQIYDTMSVLGASLANQGRYSEAEPLLLHGQEGMHPPEAQNSSKRQAIERLVRLYDAWGKIEEANRWRERLKK
jgi:tetratricopeptide (TPR) repeat protein